MIIGLGPEYNYPKKFEEWSKDNTEYASNHGASLICRALIKQFDGDFVSVKQFSEIESLQKKYDRCIIAFATHVTTWRDVSVYTNFIEKLKLPTYAFSLGVQDYSGNTKAFLKIHPSFKRLLEIVSEHSEFIGVRGPHTAAILAKNGFNNVVPIGCPTVYWNLNSTLEVNKQSTFNNPALVYQPTMSSNEGIHLLSEIPIIGQDFLDEVVFTNNLKEDNKLIRITDKEYEELGNKKDALGFIDKNGVFQSTFQEWFDYIGSKDFIVGPRLHGCVCALIQGIPAVMFARDLRVTEIAEFYNIPYVSYKNLPTKKNVQQIYNEADYTKFNETYKMRYNNYVKFLAENKLESNLDATSLINDLLYTNQDIRTMNNILNKDIQDIKLELNEFKHALQTADALYKGLGKIPFIKRIGKSIH